jgi:DNA polymerase V
MLPAPSLAPQRPASNPAGEPTGLLPPPFALPLFAHKVPAGFPSPAEDYAEGVLDLNDYLVTDPGATTFVTLPDDALQDRGIRAGDILIVHRGLPPKAGDLVWTELDGQTLVRELRRQGARYWLCAYHPDFPPLYPRDGQELRIRGVVIAMVRAIYPVPGSHPPPYA